MKGMLYLGISELLYRRLLMFFLVKFVFIDSRWLHFMNIR